MITYFEVEFLHRAETFLNSLKEKERNKIYYNLKKATLLNDKTLFKELQDGIYEFRTRFNKKQFRLLAFWDKRDRKNTLVICTHGFIKKTDKVQRKEIEIAVRMKKKYFDKS